MSIRNDRTGRHEDDLMDEAYRHNGAVSVLSLVEHLEQIVALPGTFGSNVSDAANAAASLIRDIAASHPEVLDIQNAEVQLNTRRPL